MARTFNQTAGLSTNARVFVKTPFALQVAGGQKNRSRASNSRSKWVHNLQKKSLRARAFKHMARIDFYDHVRDSLELLQKRRRRRRKLEWRLQQQPEDLKMASLGSLAIFRCVLTSGSIFTHCARDLQQCLMRVCERT